MEYLGLEDGLIGPLGPGEGPASRDAVAAISSTDKSSSQFFGILLHLNTFVINAKLAQLERNIHRI